MKNLIAILLITLAACQSPSNNKDELRLAALEKLQSGIDSVFTSKIAEHEPGAAVLVAYDQHMIVGKGFGSRDLETGEPITPTTNMRMASVSKQFTALSILTLVDKGVLSLNDSLTKFWNYPVFYNISVQHLLNHTSGLPDYYDAFSNGWDTTKIVENKDILVWLSTNPKPLFAPGERWMYSNTAFVVLALLVEKVSGQEFAAYAKANVFEPAGMKNTNYYNLAKPIDIKERAYCYEKDSLGNAVKVDGFYMNGLMGDGAVYTSISDYFNYDNSLRNKSILSEEMHGMIFKPTSMPLTDEEKSTYNFLKPGEQRYAMGWFVTDDMAFHTGSWMGTNTIVVREFKRPLTIAIFLNFVSPPTRKELIESTYKLANEYIETITALEE